MSEEMMKLAYEFGVGVARREIEKRAGRYEEGVDEEWPMANRMKQHGSIGAILGGLGAGMATMPRRGGLAHTLAGTGIGALLGGTLGLSTGGIHGSYDAGLVHALKKRENPAFDDDPSTRAMLWNGLLGAGASEAGKNRGWQEKDLAVALAALRNQQPPG